MYGYISGKIKDIQSNYVIVDNNGIGYLIYVPNPYSYIIEKECTIYTYSNIREDEYTLYGFKTKEEKELFLKLISVKGLGPKMALPMLATGSINLIEEAIETGNVNYLKKFPKIGDKVARQVILDLKGKLNVINTGLFAREDHSAELTDALLGLGYKQADVKKVVSKVNIELSLEDQIKEALKLLLK
ncbi:MAG: Holliday junction branch migration protein RuvA [Bacilli bacterium]|nr:Holliday junction branch migration protein RuvA [Bacilli bacterium]